MATQVKKEQIVMIYATKTVAANGTVTYTPIRVMIPGDHIKLTEASRITGLSMRQMAHLCDTGVFASAFKASGLTKSHWQISRAELLSKYPQRG